MNNVKPHQSPTSATELHRAYVYMPVSQWEAVDALRASTTLSPSQYIAHLIAKAVDAKENNNAPRARN